MKINPILFSTPMVQAILSGQKFQTRRTKGLEKITNHYFQSMVHHYHGRFTFVENGNFNPTNEDVVVVECPYGQVGDVLWVRETYLKQPKIITQKMLDDGADTWPSFDHVADCELGDIEQYKEWGWKVKPSIHMPKEACRLFLKITDIRVEQLQNISRGDAMAEGCPFPNMAKEVSPVEWFKGLWKSINGEDSWNSNPWVWVISFERIEKPKNFI